MVQSGARVYFVVYHLTMGKSLNDILYSLLAFCLGLIWAFIPSYEYFIDAVSYLRSFYNPNYAHLLIHPYHPIFPGLWMIMWSVNDVMQKPESLLRAGAMAISIFSGLGLWATYRWGRILRLSIFESLLGAMALGGIGAWAYFSNQWACYIPGISLMLIGFLIIAGEELKHIGDTKDGKNRLIRYYAGGLMLGLSASFHLLTILALPGFFAILCRRWGGIIRLITFLTGFLTAILIVWGLGALEYRHLTGSGGFSSWVSSSYGINRNFWGPFNILLQLNASYIGNVKVLFLGFFSSEWGLGILEQLNQPGWNRIWVLLEATGCIIGMFGFVVFIISCLGGWIKSRDISRKERMRGKLFGLFIIWLVLAIFSSFYVAYHSHYRLFAWAVMWWLILGIYADISVNRCKGLRMVSLIMIVVGLWGHNLIAGPLHWADRNNNPYIVEANMINETSYGSVPAIVESGSTGFARENYLSLFRRSAYCANMETIRLRKNRDVFPSGELSKQYIWVTGQALVELRWDIRENKRIVTDKTSFNIKGIRIDGLTVKMDLETPLGMVYLLKWE